MSETNKDFRPTVERTPLDLEVTKSYEPKDFRPTVERTPLGLEVTKSYKQLYSIEEIEMMKNFIHFCVVGNGPTPLLGAIIFMDFKKMMKKAGISFTILNYSEILFEIEIHYKSVSMGVCAIRVATSERPIGYVPFVIYKKRNYDYRNHNSFIESSYSNNDEFVNCFNDILNSVCNELENEERLHELECARLRELECARQRELQCALEREILQQAIEEQERQKLASDTLLTAAAVIVSNEEQMHAKPLSRYEKKNVRYPRQEYASILKACEDTVYAKSVSIIRSNLDRLNGGELLNIRSSLLQNEENDEFIFLDKVMNREFFLNRITEFLTRNNLKLTLQSKTRWMIHSRLITKI